MLDLQFESWEVRGVGGKLGVSGVNENGHYLVDVCVERLYSLRHLQAQVDSQAQLWPGPPGHRDEPKGI